MKTIEIPLIAGLADGSHVLGITFQSQPGCDRNPANGVVTITSVDLSTKVTNISTRGPVQTGDSVMIAGFIVRSDRVCPPLV